jgi:hypothetical protein
VPLATCAIGALDRAIAYCQTTLAYGRAREEADFPGLWEDGLDALFGLMRDALPDSLRETAYALCCDVAAADGHAFQAELQFLLELRHELAVELSDALTRPDLAANATEQLSDLGVQVRTSTKVKSITQGRVELDNGEVIEVPTPVCVKFYQPK